MVSGFQRLANQLVEADTAPAAVWTFRPSQHRRTRQPETKVQQLRTPYIWGLCLTIPQTPEFPRFAETAGSWAGYWRILLF